jgi:hypothetical protein
MIGAGKRLQLRNLSFDMFEISFGFCGGVHEWGDVLGCFGLSPRCERCRARKALLRGL